ncbi:MAG: hypothetical protein ACETWK_00825 [Candidatus Aminicenantaceae bacterium]
MKKTQKKSVLGILILTFLLLSPSSSESRIKFELKFFGGGNILQAGDLNSGIRGLVDNWHDDPEVTITGGRFRPIEYGFEYGAEFIVNFIPQIGIGIGACYLQAYRSSRLESTWFDGESYIDTFKPKIRAVPVSCSLHFRLPVASFLSVTATAGASYYYGTVNWNLHWELTNGQGSYDESWKSKSETIGYHGGLGFEFHLGHGISLVIEGLERFATLKDLKGDLNRIWKSPGLEQSNPIKNATFWYTEYKSLATDKVFPLVVIDSEMPSDLSYSSVRKGKVDLSGIALRTGFEIKF